MVRGYLVRGTVLSTLGLSLLLAACAKPMTGSVSTGANDGIIGGVEATGSEDFAQETVMLANVVQNSLCTASIVSNALLVTAAHCVAGAPSDLRIVFGTDLRNTKTRVVRAVDSFKTSPFWPFRHNESLNAGDIAVVKFSGGLPTGFKPAQILSDATLLKAGTVVLLAGYGITDGVSHEGSGKLRSTEVVIANPAYSDSEILLDQTAGHGACHGDSGGPAYVRINGQIFLWGVTNRGVNDPKNDCTSQAAYASIPYYSAWLQQTASELLQGDSASSYMVSY